MTPHRGQPEMGEAAADLATVEPSAGVSHPTVLHPQVAPRRGTRERLRIAIDARKLTSVESGLGNHTLNLVKGLLSEDQDLELLLVRNGHGKREALDLPRVEEVHVPFPLDSPLTPLILGRFIRRQRFDLFHSPYHLVPLGLSRPMVVTIHDINWIINPRYNSHNPVFRWAGSIHYRNGLIWSMNRARRIIVISNATRNAILEFAPWHEHKIRVVYNGVDRKRIFPMDKAEAARILEPLIQAANPFVLTVGQGSPYKNHLNAVRGFLRAFRDRPEYRMVLVRRASVSDRALARLLATPQARAQVIAVDYLAPEMLNALYNRARMVLHPSYYEGFGLPLVEAMAAGVPIVTSSLSSMPEVAGPAALLVSPSDSDAIARALTALDKDDVLRERLIAAGRQRLARFDWAESARATLDVYREVARGATREGARAARQST
jgi:glycosyltransferase involved in cell wall biosynthesis